MQCNKHSLWLPQGCIIVPHSACTAVGGFPAGVQNRGQMHAPTGNRRLATLATRAQTSLQQQQLMQQEEFALHSLVTRMLAKAYTDNIFVVFRAVPLASLHVTPYEPLLLRVTCRVSLSACIFHLELCSRNRKVQQLPGAARQMSFRFKPNL